MLCLNDPDLLLVEYTWFRDGPFGTELPSTMEVRDVTATKNNV